VHEDQHRFDANPDPDPDLDRYQHGNLDPDPVRHQNDAKPGPQHWTNTHVTRGISGFCLMFFQCVFVNLNFRISCRANGSASTALLHKTVLC
jgi:hypothetical protein